MNQLLKTFERSTIDGWPENTILKIPDDLVTSFDPYLRMFCLINCRLQKRQSFTISSVCSLHSHFIGLIVSFQIGSNLVGPSMVSKGKSFHTKKSMISRMVIGEPEEIFSKHRSHLVLDTTSSQLTFTHLPAHLVSSIQSQACIALIHLNLNRAGLPPIAPMNLYTWAFGLTCCRIFFNLKRICDPPLNTIRGLFVCT